MPDQGGFHIKDHEFLGLLEDVFALDNDTLAYFRTQILQIRFHVFKGFPSRTVLFDSDMAAVDHHLHGQEFSPRDHLAVFNVDVPFMEEGRNLHDDARTIHSKYGHNVMFLF